MPLLRVEAEKLSNQMLEAGVIEEIIEKDATFALLPFKKIVGKAYVYNREKTLSEGEFLDPYDVVPEGAATFDEIVARLRILAGDVDVDKFLDETMDDTNDQVSIQLQQKAKGLARKFHRTFATGNSAVNPKEFDGLPTLCHADQQLLAHSSGKGAITFEALDELLDAVPNGAQALIMRKGTLRAIHALMRALGGTMPEHIQLPGLTGNVPSYMGIPILINDFLAADEGVGADTCSVYAARFNEADGLHGIYGGPAAGIRVENIGTVQNKDANRFRMKWYAGTALKSTQSLARLKGVANV